MKKVALILILIFLISAVNAKQKIDIKLYGFVRNYIAYDTRESVTAGLDLFYFLPKDRKLNNDGQDLMAVPSFRFLALTSRLGVDVKGLKYKDFNFEAKIEGGFNNLTGQGGAARFRLRHAYLTMYNKNMHLLIGQWWHPMAKELPFGLAIEGGTPFTPFSRTPQLTFTYKFAKNFEFISSLIYQMQFRSTGPDGPSTKYLKYSLIPEFFVGLSFNHKSGFMAKAGVNILSIKPRQYANILADSGLNKKIVKDRITTFIPFVYLQYKYKDFQIRAKSIYAQAGEHLSLISGYASYSVSEKEEGAWLYTPYTSSVSYISAKYGRRLQGTIFLGYLKNLGTAKPLKESSKLSNIYYNKNLCNLNQAFRVTSTISYSWSHFVLGFEYNFTTAQYGEYDKTAVLDIIKIPNYKGLFNEGLHWVGNHRFLTMMKLYF